MAKLGDLSSVRKEQELVQQAAQGTLCVQSPSQPSVEDVILGLRNAHIAHFACHGITDGMDPSNSGLILEKTDAEGLIQYRLTIYKMSEQNFVNTYIAYLSACSTAGHKVPWLSEEVINVVSGFQIAGFPHVVGRLWHTVDSICLKVATRFYQALFRSSPAEWSNYDVAFALHEAVLAVRENELDMPFKWVPFVSRGSSRTKRALASSIQEYECKQLGEARRAPNGSIEVEVFWAPIFLPCDQLRGEQAIKKAKDLVIRKFGHVAWERERSKFGCVDAKAK